MYSVKSQDTRFIYLKQTFLCTSDELSEKESKKPISFKIVSKRIKCIGINLTKKMKYLCSENYKTLMKDIEDDTKKWKAILYPWI